MLYYQSLRWCFGSEKPGPVKSSASNSLHSNCCKSIAASSKDLGVILVVGDLDAVKNWMED